MSISSALEIEKLTPIKNGVYVCIDAKKKKYVLLPLEEITIKIKDKTMPLEDLFNLIFQMVEKNQKNITNIVENYNKLLEAFKQKVIVDSIKDLGGKI